MTQVPITEATQAKPQMRISPTLLMLALVVIIAGVAIIGKVSAGSGAPTANSQSGATGFPVNAAAGYPVADGQSTLELTEAPMVAGQPSLLRDVRETDLPVLADRSLAATVVSVKREPESTLAEINAGSRDGVKEGWRLAIADGEKFVGNLLIIRVDVNRSVGVVELEDIATQGEVKSGQRAIARKGE